MTDQPFSHPRWSDDALNPTEVYRPTVYDHQAAGPVRRAPLHARDGQLLGHVWTDDQAAAGFEPAKSLGADGAEVRASMWALLRDLRERDVPASDVLDPILYEHIGELRVS